VQAKTNTYPHVYLSPHLDDAVLSCGGRIWQQTRVGERVLVVTIFAAAPAPDVPLSPFAQELHARWGHLADAAVRRQEEDLAALALLGAEAVHWPYADCIYRRTPDGHFPYADEAALWGEVHPAEAGLVAELAARIAALPSGIGDEGGRTYLPLPVVYVPLGIGHHVDHQIARRAAADALASAAFGRASVHYEDYPYAEDPRGVQAALESKAMQWQAELAPLTEEALEAKVAAIACYHSQLGTFWTSSAEMATAIRAFARRTGGGRPAERYWRFRRI
jgi:LmbE family N-acetylglucosaminyl deacetylase